MHDQTQLMRHDDIAAIERDVKHGQADAHGVDGCAGVEADEEGAVLCSWSVSKWQATAVEIGRRKRGKAWWEEWKGRSLLATMFIASFSTP